MSRLLALLTALLLMVSPALSESWQAADVDINGCRMDMEAVFVSDQLIQVTVVLLSAPSAETVPEAFMLYDGPVPAGVAQPCDSGFFGYAEVDYADSLALVPVYQGEEDAANAVFLSAPEETAPVRWEVLNRSCGVYTVNASAILIDDGVLQLQTIQSTDREPGDPLVGWRVYLNSLPSGVLQSIRVPGDADDTFRCYGTVVFDDSIRSVVLVPILQSGTESLKQALVLEAQPS